VIGRLREIGAVAHDDFRRDYRHRWLAERGLELAAQAVLDVGNHILAGEFGESATEYEGIVRGLAARALQRSPRDCTDFEGEILAWLARRARRGGA
jgi:uncharacterized protein YutE (UPF0331/DUF86 family)